MIVTVNDLKRHLNIELTFVDDDEYLLSLIKVAEKAVENHINISFDEIMIENNGVLPTPLFHSILLLSANFYANREIVSFSNVYKIPFTFEYLLNQYKKYN